METDEIWVGGEGRDDPFLYSAESEMWRVNRERCGLIYGPAAAILQIAHPRIAQGVHDHSDFRGDTLGRLRRTLRGTNGIAFGRVSEAEAMKARLAAVHGEVRGEVSEGIEGGRGYSAFEPELLVWVLATLVNAAVSGYEFIYGELSLERREMFYRDMCRFGTYFGVKEEDCPRGWVEFESYFEEMIEGDFLGGHEICGQLARVIVHPRDTVGTRVLGRGIDFLGVELLPERVRGRLGLRSTAWTRARMGVLRAVLPRVWGSLPRGWRFYPEYLAAIDG
ncbi:MAG: oxygenase MpaB family protein [Verrucomicrobiota bacterium]